MTQQPPLEEGLPDGVEPVPPDTEIPADEPTPTEDNPPKEPPPVNFQYNFRLAPEAIWLIVNTVLGTILLDVLGRLSGLEAFPTVDELGGWGAAIAMAAVRTALGALLAAATGGGFQAPGQPGPTPTPNP